MNRLDDEDEPMEAWEDPDRAPPLALHEWVAFFVVVAAFVAAIFVLVGVR